MFPSSKPEFCLIIIRALNVRMNSRAIFFANFPYESVYNFVFEVMVLFARPIHENRKMWCDLSIRTRSLATHTVVELTFCRLTYLIGQHNFYSKNNHNQTFTISGSGAKNEPQAQKRCHASIRVRHLQETSHEYYL
jgi:hypothetical protein